MDTPRTPHPAVQRLRRYRTDQLVTALTLTAIGLIADAAGAFTLAYFTLLAGMVTGALGALAWAAATATHLGDTLTQRTRPRGHR